MRLTGKQVLVTGAAGFIGSHVVESLREIGANVRALVRYTSTGSVGWLQGPLASDVEIVRGDLRDRDSVEAAVSGCDVVLHLGALIAIPYSYSAPDSYVETNVRGTLNVLQASRRSEVERLVVTSTSEVYGTAQTVPITEEHPLNAQSPYAASKSGADLLALSFHRSFDLPVTIIRPFNTYGPRQSPRAVIPTIIGQVASGAGVIRLGSTHPTRDFLFVRDTARGFLAFAESDRLVGRVANIGTGFEISIGDLVNLIADVMGAEVEVETDSTRIRPANSEVDRLVAGTELARELTGWTPGHVGEVGLRRGLSETRDWYLAEGGRGAGFDASEYAV
jgi:NAD dependent epimerase/dehydratase